jgi:alpha-galactosidase
MGVELFVMDDGWFHKRNLDNAGLGDWWPDAAKFPNGLKPLVDAVNRLGMDFGLWIEPEMVNPDSDLYRAHPDWVIHFPTRARTEARNQLILNLARGDVQQYLIEKIDRLLTENHRLHQIDEPQCQQWAGRIAERSASYGCICIWCLLWQTLREKHPNVSGKAAQRGWAGESRHFANQIWVSDNTIASLEHSEAFLHFPANTMKRG